MKLLLRAQNSARHITGNQSPGLQEDRLRMGGRKGGKVPGTNRQSIMMERWKDRWMSREQSTWDETHTKYNLKGQELPQPS